MVNLNIKFGHEKYSDEALCRSIQAILSENELAGMASIRDGKSWASNAYYCFDKDLNFYALFDPHTQHAQNFKMNDSVALSIADSHQSWDVPKKGIQIFRTCRRAKLSELPKAISLYTDKFLSFGQFIKNPGDFAKGALDSRFYKITTDFLKLFDETNFGEEEFIELVPRKK